MKFDVHPEENTEGFVNEVDSEVIIRPLPPSTADHSPFTLCQQAVI